MHDVIVVGAGHAGSEAAHAAARMGSKVLLVTMNMETVAKMSCNPAMGGVAKGQIVREIDALGGMSAVISDKTMIQFRMLNRSKGPAMWSPRAQSDRLQFSNAWRLALEQTPNIEFYQDMVVDILVKNGKVAGVKTAMGLTFHSRAVILTSGTFLNGLIHIGRKQFGGGRMGERNSTGITEKLEELGFESGRMKTGTPPRVDGRSLDYSKMEEQPGDESPEKFSFRPTQSLQKQRSCHITYTNPIVHDILREGFDDSPMFNGAIKSIGPRYCPSVEDKVNRFAERERHQIFVEPEGWDTVEVYVNGFSTSLPLEIQNKAIKHIPGFENVKIFRPGYAIEYDYFPPTQLSTSLETKLVENLFFAGQINGTTGYEEAAAQGLMAGINAHRKLNDLEPVVLNRSQAYIGVLIDDLINKGTQEPYRMFTSRAEYRILLRQDNADQRLSPIGYEIGLLEEEQYNRFQEKYNAIQSLSEYLRETSITPDEINPLLKEKGSSPIPQNYKLDKIISRPEIQIPELQAIKSFKAATVDYPDDVLETVEIETKYAGYILRERELVEKMNKLEYIKIHPTFDFSKVKSLSSEAREKLMQIKPQTIGQASRISGVSPADVSVLLVHLGR